MMHAMMRPWSIPSSFPHAFSCQTPASSSSWVSSLQFVHYCMHTPRRRDKDSCCNENPSCSDPIRSHSRGGPPFLLLLLKALVVATTKDDLNSAISPPFSLPGKPIALQKPLLRLQHYHPRPRCLTPCPTLLRNSCCSGATRSCARSIDRALSLSSLSSFSLFISGHTSQPLFRLIYIYIYIARML